MTSGPPEPHPIRPQFNYSFAMKPLRYRKTTTPSPISSLIILAISGVGFVGWITNIIKIIQADFSHIDGELVVRIIGIPVAPVGAVAGWIP
mgnify:CR=1 FL=1